MGFCKSLLLSASYRIGFGEGLCLASGQMCSMTLIPKGSQPYTKIPSPLTDSHGKLKAQQMHLQALTGLNLVYIQRIKPNFWALLLLLLFTLFTIPSLSSRNIPKLAWLSSHQGRNMYLTAPLMWPRVVAPSPKVTMLPSYFKRRKVKHRISLHV